MTDGVFIPTDMPTRAEIEQVTNGDRTPVAVYDRFHRAFVEWGNLTPEQRNSVDTAEYGGACSECWYWVAPYPARRVR